MMDGFAARRRLVIQEIRYLMYSGSILSSVFYSSFPKLKKIFGRALTIKAFYDDYNYY